MKTDFLVIGSGAAGLSFALKAAAHGHVTIVTKGAIEECNTNYAQGGICSVTYAPDTFEKHIRDTLICGAGKCDEKAVELVVRRAPELIADLIAWGTRFDKTPDGRFELNREGGHSEHRILHHEDLTGAEIERALVQSVREHPNITVLERHFAIDLLTQHHLGEFVTRHTRGLASFGAYVLNLDTNEIETMLSKFTVVATGGCGNVYSTTSNPVVATGDGIAMCHRAKAMTENMEFIQFHPTTLYNPGEKPNFLITEAMRGFGAILRLPDGKEFMDKYHPMKSLAPRDVVARAIYREMTKRGSDFVYLDVTHKDPEAVKSHFPNIYEKCRSIGIDITKDWIPVTPAAHYCCGGVKVDTNGETSVKRLYALGETSCTGLHGANRLASNSLIEAVVYADQAARHTASLLEKVDFQEGIPDWDFEGTQHTEEMLMIIQSKREMQTIMSNYVGIVRSNLSLKRAMHRLEILWQETEELYNKTKPNRELCELRNMIAIAYLVIKQGREIKESVGCHYNADYPPEDSRHKRLRIENGRCNKARFPAKDRFFEPDVKKQSDYGNSQGGIGSSVSRTFKRIMTLQEEITRRRTFAVIAHPDAGKTTLTEKLLLFGGAIHVAGAVKSNKIKKGATSDFMEIERQRGISVATAVMGFEYRGCKINILDTPGHEDFAEDTYRTLTAVDSVIIVIDGAKGVEAQTRKLMEVCRMRQTPVIVFINKLDRPSKEPFDLLDEVEKELHIRVRPLAFPISNGPTFKGVYNLYEKNLSLFTSDEKLTADASTAEISDLASQELEGYIGEKFAAQLRSDVELVEGVYDQFDRDAYLAGRTGPGVLRLGGEQFRRARTARMLRATSPPRRAPRRPRRGSVEPAEEKMTGFVFKIHANMDPNHRDRIAFLKICSGTLRAQHATTCTCAAASSSNSRRRRPSWPRRSR